MNKLQRKNTNFWCICLAILLLLSAFNIYALAQKRLQTRALTVADLPQGVHYVRHESEEQQAQEARKMVMQHYATPEAIQNGGPAFGVVGYRIVSIEYEVPIDKIPEKTVGQLFPGYLLKLPGLGDVPYDHFHISHHRGALSGMGKTGEEYSIHFMLISHAEELSLGLVCE